MDPLGRRAVLTAGLGLVAAGCTATPEPITRETRDTFDPKNWDDVRALFPLSPKLVQTAAFVLAAHPKPVRDAINRHRDGLDKDTEAYLHKYGELEEEVRAVAATFLGGTTDQVAFTDSTTMGLGILYSGLRLRPDQDVITSTHDFTAHHRALDQMAQRTGAPVRRIALYDEPTAPPQPTTSSPAALTAPSCWPRLPWSWWRRVPGRWRRCRRGGR